MDKFQNKYRIPSARLQNWDYRWPGFYFITICTQNRIHYFGEIVNQQIHLSEIGKIVESEWLKTFELRFDMNLFKGEFVVMPNHFHAIIGIGENAYNTKHDERDECDECDECRDAMHCVSTTESATESATEFATEFATTTANTTNHFGPQSKNLASIVRGFKSSVTIAARIFNTEFQWQARFHDHIIRNDESFQKISNYIINNAANWQDDKFFNE